MIKHNAAKAAQDPQALHQSCKHSTTNKNETNNTTFASFPAVFASFRMCTQELEHKAHGSGARAQLLPSALFCWHSAVPLLDVVWGYSFKFKRSERKGTFIKKKQRTEVCHARKEQSRLRASKNIDTESFCWFLPLRPRSGKGVKLV